MSLRSSFTVALMKGLIAWFLLASSDVFVEPTSLEGQACCRNACAGEGHRPSKALLALQCWYLWDRWTRLLPPSPSQKQASPPWGGRMLLAAVLLPHHVTRRWSVPTVDGLAVRPIQRQTPAKTAQQPCRNQTLSSWATFLVETGSWCVCSIAALPAHVL